MKDSAPAPTPDPKIGEAALKQAQTGEDWLSFAKDSFQVSTARQADLDALTKQVTTQQLGIAQDQADWSRSDRQRYETTFKPVEDQFVQEASNYGSPEKQEEAAAEAKADVQSNAAGARAAADRNAASLGISPTSGRYAGIDRASEMGTALASAGAENTARTAVRDKGLALKADVVNLGRGLPTQSAQAASLGLGAGSSAVGLNQGTNAQFQASTNIMNNGFSGAQQGYAGQASTLNNLYGSQLQAWQAQQQADASSASGIGSAIGGIAGLFLSDENLKTDKTELPEGTALKAVMDMPVEEWTYKQGVADGGRHVGTYAQDFKAATGKGDGRSIPAQDAIGITMKAVQDLAGQVQEISAAIGLGGGATPAKRKAPSADAIGLGVAA